MNLYHKIYKMVQKKIPADQIAITLGIPLRDVKDVIKTMNENTSAEKMDRKSEEKKFLDIYETTTTRLTSLELVGFLTKETAENISSHLEKQGRSNVKNVVFNMNGITEVDEVGFSAILKFHNKLKASGRRSAILDPSPNVDNFIVKNNIEDEMEIFGTQTAMENVLLRNLKS